MLTSQQGKTIPQLNFRTRKGADWVDLTTDDLFKNKTVVVFSLPGAFTPTCSTSHVPRYNELAATFKANGVDDIICVSVNDGFVMKAWQEEQKADQLRFLPDGNGDLTAALGMLVDKAELGFGKRSWRYSMLVKNAVIEKMFIEPEIPGDPYQVSDADTMLDYINDQAHKPLDIALFTRKDCSYCAQAKTALLEEGLDFEELLLNRDFKGPAIRAVSGQESFPQVFIRGEHIGGATELLAWLQEQVDTK